MFRTIIISIMATLSILSASTAIANEANPYNAYRVVDNRTGEILSWVSFAPIIVWENGHPYVDMIEYDSMKRMHHNLYSYHDIFLEPLDPKQIID